MSLEFYILSFVFALFLGYSFSSERFFSGSNLGQVALFLLAIVALSLVGWAIWIDNWFSGLIESTVIISGFLFERMLSRALSGG